MLGGMIRLRFNKHSRPTIICILLASSEFTSSVIQPGRQRHTEMIIYAKLITPCGDGCANITYNYTAQFN